MDKRIYKPLSDKELITFKHLCDGLHNKEIAEKMDLSEYTVKRHLNVIYKKLGVKTRFQAIAMKSNLIPDGSLPTGI